MEFEEFKLIPSSTRKNKRFTAHFIKYDALGTPITLKVHFGQKGGSTFIDHGDENKKANYISRHQHNFMKENWEDPTTPGALSRWILWEHKDIHQAVRAFKKRFKLK